MALNINGTTGISGVDGSVSAPALTGTDSNTGITFPSADTIKFATGGVERMSITNSGVSGITTGITMADMWRMSASHTVATTNTTISSNWERVDSNSFAQIGTGMTESSGYFSFPQTGIYQIDWHAQLNNNSNNERYVNNVIWTTTNNSSYAETAFVSAGMGTDSHRAQIDTRFIFDVTDTSTHKFYIQEYSYNGSTSMYGNTTYNFSYLTVLRLGDT